MMSTTSNLEVAVRYSLSAGSLLFKLEANNFMVQGAGQYYCCVYFKCTCGTASLCMHIFALSLYPFVLCVRFPHKCVCVGMSSICLYCESWCVINETMPVLVVPACKMSLSVFTHHYRSILQVLPPNMLTQSLATSNFLKGATNTERCCCHAMSPGMARCVFQVSMKINYDHFICKTESSVLLWSCQLGWRKLLFF